MKQLFIFLSFTFVFTEVMSQNTGSIKGKLIDTIAKQPLKDASVTLLDAKDSTLELFGLAKQDGSLLLENVSMGDFILQIKFYYYL